MSDYERLGWIDLETSGLDRERCHILEVGIVITDRKLVELARQSWLVKPVGVFYAEIGAMAMHDRAGLLAECEASGLMHGDVEDHACAFLIDWQANGSPMCGAGVGFDRAFLSRNMPRLAEHFHYRNFDVSTFRVAAAIAGVDAPAKREAHRALDDLEDALALARWALNASWRQP